MKELLSKVPDRPVLQQVVDVPCSSLDFPLEPFFELLVNLFWIFDISYGRIKIMKKVSKMALAFVALASFVCFLFYKWRYDKLYSVLEVLEFFGNVNSASLGTAVNGFASRSSWRLQHPPAWQRLSNGTFAYSAHCSRTPGSNDMCPAVTILSISSLHSVNDLHKLTCQLW